ncbi:MAG TPA: MFS transporter [Nocardioidaceae bacterium]|nr:MFS transporter [Nocardioidaceae bacterium]
MATAVAEERPAPSAFAVFRRRSFSLLWSGQFVSTIGDALLLAAAGIVVYRQTGSAASVSLMLVATMGPALIVGLVAGVYVDRLDRRKIMIASDLIRVGLVAVMPVLLSVNIALLYVLVALAAGVSEFFNPALDASLPEIAPDEELGAANSLMAISSFGSTAVGFAAGGLLAAIGDISWAFYADALSFAISAGCTTLATIPRVEPSGEGASSVGAVFRNLRDGVRVLIQTPILRSMLGIGAIYGLAAIGIWNALLLPFSLSDLHATTFEYGLQEGLTSVGFVVGSLLMAKLVMRIQEGQWLVFGFFVMGAGGLVYGLSHSIALALIAITVSGFANAFTATAGRLIRQRNSPPQFRGRVMSAFSVIAAAFSVVGMGIAALADLLGVRLLILVSAVLTLVVAVAAALLPGLRAPTADWRRVVGLLRTAATIGSLGTLRPVTIADFEALVGLVPSLAGLERHGRENLLLTGHIAEPPAGTTVMAQGDPSDAAYFVLAGTAVAGTPTSDGEYRSLSTMGPGDFFGEIGALRGTPRTATIVAEENMTLLQVPAATLRSLMTLPEMHRIIERTVEERLSRTSLTDLPKIGGIDQDLLRQLRQN